MSFSCIGTGSAIPALCITNDALAERVDTSDAWIRTRTGVCERRLLSTETLSELALRAAQAALENAGVSAAELDLILCATIRGDMITPSMACLLQAALGASCPAMDINAACSGFLYALDVADGYFTRGRAKKALVVAAEAMSSMVDWEDRATCVLFGDGAGAVVLSEGTDLLALQITASGNAEHLNIPNLEGDSPFYTRRQGKKVRVHMNGQEVYKFAVSALCDGLRAVIAQAGLREEDVSWVLPHQANSRIIDAAKGRLSIPPERYLHNIERLGNSSAATIPILLDECNRAHRFHKGDILAMSAFGGGFTTGACALRWSRDS